MAGVTASTQSYHRTGSARHAAAAFAGTPGAVDSSIRPPSPRQVTSTPSAKREARFKKGGQQAAGRFRKGS
jgi:hypothetical protein